MAQSVLARLKTRAQTEDRAFSELLTLYAVERFLHRLGRSRHRDAFVLKGALMLRHWLDLPARPTRDIDLLGPSGLTVEGVRAVVREILAAEVEDDGIEYEPETLDVEPIRLESPVLGLRVRFTGFLGRTELNHQVDIGLGDEVYPPSAEVKPTALLDLPVASVKAYTPYTAIAEKLEAVVILGDANSRMKDYHDFDLLSRELAFDGTVLVEALRRTFRARGTPFPQAEPRGLTADFAANETSRKQWRAFLAKSALAEPDGGLAGVVARVRDFLMPVLEAAREGDDFQARWSPGGPWRSRPGPPTSRSRVA
jgi:hypothetical protein